MATDEEVDKEIEALSYHDLLVYKMTITWLARLIFFLGFISTSFAAEYILSDARNTWIGLACLIVAVVLLIIIVPMLALLKKIRSVIHRKFGGMREE
jgi:Na+/phosphate symporter